MNTKPDIAPSFLRDRSGNIAILFAASLMPVLLAVGVAVDLGRAYSSKHAMQNSVDAAALAAVSFTPTGKDKGKHSNHSEQRREFAESMFNSAAANIKHAENVKVDVKVNGNTVTVQATANVPTTFGALAISKFDIATRATATKTDTTAPICLLSLNEEANHAFQAHGKGHLNALQCVVHSNSTHHKSMQTSNSATANASTFCSSGRYSGSGFSPKPETNCGQQQDPYSEKLTLEKLLDQGINISKNCTHTKKYTVKKNEVFDAGGAEAVLNFCDGLEVQKNSTATFKPGIYVIHKQLRIRSNASIDAPEGVTFFFPPGSKNGRKDAQFNVDRNGNINLTAPTSGPLAGMAIVQPEVSTHKGGSNVSLTHDINAGGDIHIVGNVYTPQARFRIKGGGDVNQKSSYFTIVANLIDIHGTRGNLNVRVEANWEANNMPDLGTVSSNSLSRLVN